MSAEYSLALLVSGQSVAAGTPFTSNWFDLSGCLDATLSLSIVNGATGPTVAAQVQVQYANDYNGGSPTSITAGNDGGPLQSNTGNSVTTAWGGQFLPGGGAVRFVVSGNTGQAVTFSADINKRVSL